MTHNDDLEIPLHGESHDAGIQDGTRLLECWTGRPVSVDGCRTCVSPAANRIGVGHVENVRACFKLPVLFQCESLSNAEVEQVNRWKEEAVGSGILDRLSERSLTRHGTSRLSTGLADRDHTITVHLDRTTIRFTVLGLVHG